MVLIWFAHRKKPRIYHTPQEAWSDLLQLGLGGFHGVGLPVRMQAWASEMDFHTFAHSGEFFPADFVESIYRHWRQGEREPMLALVRGLLMYVVLKPRWEKVLTLVAASLLQAGKSPQVGKAVVRELESGDVVAVGTFYGRYPVFTLRESLSQAQEEILRGIGLRRMDSYRRARFPGYTRWIPAEYPPEEEGEGEADVRSWVPVPLPQTQLWAKSPG